MMAKRVSWASMAAHEHEVLGEEACIGGMPASENISIVAAVCSRRIGRGQARQIADLLDIAAFLAAHGEDDPRRCAERHDHVDEHVERNAAHAAMGPEARPTSA